MIAPTQLLLQQIIVDTKSNHTFILDLTSFSILSSSSLDAKQQASFSELPEAYELYYTGSSLVLLSAGESTNGTVQYKLGDGEWTTTRPVATNVGTYTVYAKVVATDTENYIDSDVLESFITL